MLSSLKQLLPVGIGRGLWTAFCLSILAASFHKRCHRTLFCVEVFLKVLLVLKSEVWHFAVKIPRMLLLVLESTCLPCSLGLMFTSAAGKSPEFRPGTWRTSRKCSTKG